MDVILQPSLLSLRGWRDARRAGQAYRCHQRLHLSMAGRHAIFSAQTVQTPPTVIDSILELPLHYKAVLLDQFGVLHDGQRPYPDAIDSVQALAARGLKLLVLSNSSRRCDGALAKIIGMGFPAEAFAGVMTSGEVAHVYLHDRPTQFWQDLGRRCLHLTWGTRGSISLEGLDLQVVEDVEQAEFILAHGTEALGRGNGLEPVPISLEDVQELLRAAAKRQLPLLIANPDFVTVEGSELRIMPGTFGGWYAEMGGDVHALGKPAPAIYDAAMQMLDVTDPKQVVAIGDSLIHDIAGAQAAGCDSVLVAGGILSKELGQTARDLTVNDDQLEKLCRKTKAWPTYVIPFLQT